MLKKDFERLLLTEKVMTPPTALATLSECTYEVAYAIITGKACPSMKRIRTLMARCSMTLDEADAFVQFLKDRWNATRNPGKTKLGQVLGVKE